MYLLSTQALMDLICGRPEMSDWVRSIAATEVHISSLSVAHVQAEVLATSPDLGRDELDRALLAILAFARRANLLEVFDERAAQVYARLPAGKLLRQDGTELGDLSRMVIATSIERGLVLIEEPQPYHQYIPNLRRVNPAARGYPPTAPKGRS